MRYQRSFPNVIPLLKAGCSRVTHPSATDPRSKLLFTVRLACVKRAASVRPEPGSNSLVSLYFNTFTVFKIYPVQFFKTDFQFFSLFLTSFLFLALLCFTKALLGIFKGFFWSFIVQFSRFRFTQKLSFELSLSRETAYLLYHIFLSLSSTFSTFFQILFRCVPRAFQLSVCLSLSERMSLSERAFISYHIQPLLSRLFSAFVAVHSLCAILVEFQRQGAQIVQHYQPFTTNSTLFYTSFTLKYLHLRQYRTNH